MLKISDSKNDEIMNMTKMSLGMEFYIDYAHKLKGHPLCDRPHGHTAKILVEIMGNTGGGDSYQDNMVLDFSEMKEISNSILEKLDHHDLNEVFDMPTSENITKWIFENLSPLIPLKKITFFEGNGKWCTIEV